MLSVDLNRTRRRGKASQVNFFPILQNAARHLMTFCMGISVSAKVCCSPVEPGYKQEVRLSEGSTCVIRTCTSSGSVKTGPVLLKSQQVPTIVALTFSSTGLARVELELSKITSAPTRNTSPRTSVTTCAVVVWPAQPPSAGSSALARRASAPVETRLRRGSISLRMRPDGSPTPRAESRAVCGACGAASGKSNPPVPSRGAGTGVACLPTAAL